mmetsp:Transcript_35175/g.87620  ORF Transcript_35175/g.87620 Transcript_35175/m.87620 type:complete len:204 (-) Transcript_35175:2063-2674(-)
MRSRRTRRDTTSCAGSRRSRMLFGMASPSSPSRPLSSPRSTAGSDRARSACRVPYTTRTTSPSSASWCLSLSSWGSSPTLLCLSASRGTSPPRRSRSHKPIWTWLSPRWRRWIRLARSSQSLCRSSSASCCGSVSCSRSLACSRTWRSAFAARTYSRSPTWGCAALCCTCRATTMATSSPTAAGASSCPMTHGASACPSGASA